MSPARSGWATRRERLQEFQRVDGHGPLSGHGARGADARTRSAPHYPFVETHDLTGALYDPYDGDIDPAQLTQALAKGARAMGARIERFCPATGVRREGGEWVVSTPKGEIRCEIVVNAAGYYAREVGKWFGRDVPMMVMSHQYMLFDTIPELAAWSAEVGHKLPLLRDVDSSYYLRQEKQGFNLGPYERNCNAHWITPDDPFPQDFSFQLFPDDLDRLEWLYRRCHGPRAASGKGEPDQGHQRPDPLYARRQPADRPDARRAQRLRGLRLHLRHLPGRRRGQGAGRMGHRRHDRMGHVVLRPAPLHRLRQTKTTASPRGWRSTATNTPSTSRITPGPPDATASCRRSTTRTRALGARLRRL